MSVSQNPEKPRASLVVSSDVKAKANVASSKTSLDIPTNKPPSLQESTCLNTKIIKDIDVKSSHKDVKVLAELPPVIRTEGMVSADVPSASVVCLDSLAPSDAAEMSSSDDVKSSPGDVKVLAEPPPVIRTEEMVSADMPSDSVLCLGTSLMPAALASCWETAVVGLSLIHI